MYNNSATTDTDKINISGYNSDDSIIRDPIDKLYERRLNGWLPMNIWRNVPDTRRFNPLALALSRAAIRMPEIRALEFHMCRDDDMMGDVGISLHGEEGWGSWKPRQWRVVMGRNAQWEPPEEVIALWREFAGKGGEVIIQRDGDDHEEYMQGSASPKSMSAYSDSELSNDG